MIATAVDVVTAAPVLAVAFVIQQINDGAVPGAAAPGADPTRTTETIRRTPMRIVIANTVT